MARGNFTESYQHRLEVHSEPIGNFLLFLQNGNSAILMSDRIHRFGTFVRVYEACFWRHISAARIALVVPASCVTPTLPHPAYPFWS